MPYDNERQDIIMYIHNTGLQNLSLIKMLDDKYKHSKCAFKEKNMIHAERKFIKNC